MRNSKSFKYYSELKTITSMPGGAVEGEILFVVIILQAAVSIISFAYLS